MQIFFPIVPAPESIKRALLAYFGGWVQATTTHAPFPELAEAIHGAKTDDVIGTLKELAQIVVKICKVKALQSESNLSQDYVNRLLNRIDVEFLNRTSNSETRSTRLRISRQVSLSRRDAKKVLKFLHTHSDRLVGNPERVVLWHSGETITAAEQWVTRCLIQAYTEDHPLRLLWSQYLEEQPEYRPVESVQERYENNVRRLDGDGSHTSFLGLVQVLRSFVKADSFDEKGVSAVIRIYIWLGVSAAELWSRRWRSRGIQRGQPLPEDDHFLRVILGEFKDTLKEMINNWQEEIPLHVRQVLAKHCFGGDFLFLTNHFFPRMIAPSGSRIRENLFAIEMYRFIITVATFPNVDPQGLIRRCIQEHDWRPEIQPDGLGIQPQFSNIFNSFQLFSEDGGLENIEYELLDVELEAHGPLIDIHDIAEPCVTRDVSNCAICQQDMADEDLGCVKPIVCDHTFHWPCLHTWVNGVHNEQVLCPVCRAKVCDARPRRIKMETEPARLHGDDEDLIWGVS